MLGGNWDCPEALRTDELIQHVDALRCQNGPIDYPFYDFKRNRRDPSRAVPVVVRTGGVVLVEGLVVSGVATSGGAGCVTGASTVAGCGAG